MKRSHESMQVTERHGQGGNYLIRCDVPGSMKDALIDIADAKNWWFKDVVMDALETYIERNKAA